MIHPHPNWLQRRYFTWAQPHYDRMEPALRDEVQQLDLWLYSRRGLAAWAAAAGLMCGSAGLWLWLGWPPALAVTSAVLLWGAIGLALLSAWLLPQRYTLGRLMGLLLMALGAASAGVMAGVLAGRLRHGRGLEPAAIAQPLLAAWPKAWVVVATVGTPLLLALWAVAALRRHRMAQALSRALHARQQDQARLHALQAQIQPHFLFNTLATVQHWVDSGDARASGLLRELTAFLRSATMLLARPRVTLAEEMVSVGHYLTVHQMRLGERLRSHIELPPGCADFALPPGLVLTLVENAIEHGLAPALAGGELRVRTWRDDTALHLSVTDTGVGLTAGAVDGTGLANTRARLSAAWGERARLTVTAREGGGTAAHIRVEGA